MGTKGARLSTNLALASKYLVLMPRGDQVGLSQKITDERERLRLFKLLRPLAESSDMGLIARTLSEGSPASSLNDDFNHLLRQWARVVKTAEGAKALARSFRNSQFRHVWSEIWSVVKPRLSSSMMQTYISDSTTI